MTHYGNELFSEIIHISDGAFPIREDAEELRPASAAALLLYAAGKGDLLQSADAVRRAERAIRRERKREDEMTKIKLCGLTRIEDALAANDASPDLVGLVFEPGRHFVSDETAAAIRKALRADIPAVGVFVREPEEHVLSLLERGIIQGVQLHGDEPEEYLCR